VDDNDTSRKIMSGVLEHYGYRIEQAVNGREALEFLEKEDFDLILMDLDMPVMDGIETAKAIRKGDNFVRFRSGKSIPIIALTGSSDDLSIRNIKEAGMNYHLCKPVFKDKLTSAINMLLQNNISESDAVIDKNTVEQEQPNIVFWNTINNEQILDRSVIDDLKEIGGDELIVSLFETFITDANKLMAELAEAVAVKNMKQFDHIIHTLKGTTGSIGANKMYLLCGHINEFSRKGEWPDDNSWIQAMHTVYAETVKELHNHIDLFAQHPS
jgi:two-component system CAI-1 autoinducer sensor kinase/phosphatase CqsS